MSALKWYVKSMRLVESNIFKLPLIWLILTLLSSEPGYALHISNITHTLYFMGMLVVVFL